VIIEIFITESQAVDPLRYQLLNAGLNEIRIPVIPEAGRKLAHDPDALLNLSQQQPTAFGSDGSAVELGSNLSMF
jgi:hypothetical protein